MYYPLTAPERAAFRTKAGKRVTEHQWAVYDLVRNIPAGQVSTYKDICVALGSGSPRSVGGALRNNPFAPYVPCHRIVASNLFIGGFFGEWTDLKQSSSKDAQKIRMLAMEGVLFDKSGKLIGSEEFTWKG
ncbi:methylated-DNA--cysteine S-met [Auriscalpium vulgare]|uniref:Methylated-DNA--cysteine S-met n=1 Tax=Auriscalpium vulgare TaxID=40419 RepID=A0ACB8SA41_9AGAM|nr:methylated-DNA--cysteine S-met [Auriscalpium vulgare]